MTKRCFYEVLGVAKGAGDDDIKKAYRTLAMKHHPDRNSGDEEAAHLFKEAAEAYAVLSDPQKKQLYDRYGHDGLSNVAMPDFSSNSSVFDLFGDFFDGIFGRGSRRQRGPQPGEDLGLEVEIDLVEAARGCKKSLTIPRQETCPDCRGSGCKRGSSPAQCRTCKGQGAVFMSQGFFRVQQTCRSCGGAGAIIADPCGACDGRGRVQTKRTLEVEIPPGVFHGLRFPVQGEGNAGQPGGPRGDLIIVLHVAEHALFKRDGDHLVTQVPISMSQAALGGAIEVPTLDGPVEQALKAGVQSGDVVIIKGKGMPNLRGGRRGDLYVQMIIETPKHLTKRQEELFRELAELDKKHVSPQRKSFFEKIKAFFASSKSE